MTKIERLLAIEDIKALKARYFRCVDCKDWIGYAALFASDVHFDASTAEVECKLHTPQAIVAMTSAGLKDCVSVHHGHCPEITITSDTTAEGTWAMEDILRWSPGASSPLHTLHGYGYYLETYQRIDGAWRIQTMKLIRLRVDTTPRDQGLFF